MFIVTVAVLVELVRSTLGALREQLMRVVATLGAHDRFTVPVKPFSALTVMVDVPCWPGADTELTRPAIEKSALGVAASQAVIRLLTLSEPKPVT